MPTDATQLQKRKQLALDAIKAAYGTDDDEYGGTLFVSHHLEELEPSYWQDHFKTEKPKPQLILDSLILMPDSVDGDIDSLDFTLPGDVTDYVICVSFSDTGEIEGISMES